MKDNENTKTEVKLTEVSQKEKADTEISSSDKTQKLKKLVIFVLMGLVCLGCMYLIFSPSSAENELTQIGMNETVPQATDSEMPADKGKAYESELLEQKEKDNKQSLAALSAYWNADSAGLKSGTMASGMPENTGTASGVDHHQQALNSYKGIQSTLGNFYNDRGQDSHLEREVKSLKAQLAQKEATQPNPVESQLALMEKSYQMAAKYFPNTGNVGKTEEKVTKNLADDSDAAKQKSSVTRVSPIRISMVSALYREPSDSAWIAGLGQTRNRNFHTIDKPQENNFIVNSIRACIHDTQTITPDQSVKVRLLDAVRFSKMLIPKGTVLTGIAKFQGLRLQLLIQSVEYQGSIIPVEIAAYDVDGQPGLALPYSPERSALTEVAANMGNTGGTSISLSSNAGQQITSDLSKSLVQGISGYFSKKVRMPKVTLKAGYQVFLVAKK